MNIYFVEYGLTDLDVREFVQGFVFFNRDGVLGYPIEEMEWDYETLLEFCERGVILGFRLNESGDKYYIYLHPEFKKILARAIYTMAIREVK